MPSVRFDREITIGVAQPIRQLTRGIRDVGIPILMYHGIREGNTSRHPYFATHTSPKAFASHMRYLAENGYKTITLSEAVRTAHDREKNSRVVAITFDDGYMDFHSLAFPILIDYGFTASVFVVSDFAQAQPKVSGHAPYMSWAEIRRVHQHGIEIGLHSASHPRLSELSPAKMDAELELSKRAIEDALGSEVQSFSYPYGFPKHDRAFVARIRCQLKAYGYRNAVTTLLGTAGRGCDEFALPRLPINSHDDLGLFKAKLEGAYDWLYVFQSLWKSLKADPT